MIGWQTICALDALSEDEPLGVIVDGVELALFRLEDNVYALHDLCSHGVAKLSEGYIEDGCIECPLHQGLFDIKTGAPQCAPVTEAVRSFPIRLVEAQVQVLIDDAQPVATTSTSTRNMEIAELNQINHDVMIMKLKAQQNAVLDIKPGQYIDIIMDQQRRSYSVANTNTHEHIELHLRHMPGGFFTEKLFSQQINVGQQLDIDGPHGSFYLRETEKPIIFVASGTGFAPIQAMIQSMIDKNNTRQVSLYWGGRTPADIYLAEQTQCWMDELSWLTFIPVVSDAAGPEHNWSGRTGLVHQAVMQDIPSMQGYEVYACGAPLMVSAAQMDFISSCHLEQEAFYADAFLSKADSIKS